MNQDFVKNVLSLRGKVKGQKWLDNIPELLKTYETKWGLKAKGAFEDLSINYVEKAQTKNGEDVVLKIGFPEDQEFSREVSALEIYNGNGAVKILREDLDNSVLLLEACLPGKPLHSLNDEEKEILIFTNTAKRVWKKVTKDSEFPKLSDEVKYFDWYFGNKEKAQKYLPEELVKKALEKYKNLIESQKELYLLHSDLHHDNILSSDRGWLAIDPRGLIGEREFKAGVFIIDPLKSFKEIQDLFI